MKSSRMLRNLGGVAIFLLGGSLPCFAGSSQLNFNLFGAGSASFNPGGGGVRGTLPDGSDFFVSFDAGPPTSVTGNCDQNSAHCELDYTYGSGGSITIGFDNQTFTGLILGAGGSQLVGTSDPVGQDIFATFTLSGYNGVGAVSAGDNFGSMEHGSVSFTGTPTPEPGSFLLLFSGAGILAGLIRRKMCV